MKQKTLYRKIASKIWGYDIFISYRHVSAQTYARRLHESLEAAGLIVFQDASEPNNPGTSIKEFARLAQSARCLVIILTPDVFVSASVEEEITGYFKNRMDKWYRKPFSRIISINVDQTLSNIPAGESVWRRLENFVYEPESPQAIVSGVPGKEVIRRVKSAGTFMNSWKRFIVLLGLSIIVLLVISAMVLVSLNALQKNVKKGQLANRYRSSLLFADMAEKEIAARNFAAAAVYLSKGNEDSASDRIKALRLILSGDRYLFMGQPGQGNKLFTSVVIEPSQKKIITAGADSLLYFYTIDSAIQLSHSIKFSGNITDIQIDSGGKLLAVAVSHKPDIMNSESFGSVIFLIDVASRGIISEKKIKGNFCDVQQMIFGDKEDALLVATGCNVLLLDFSGAPPIQIEDQPVSHMIRCDRGLYAGISTTTFFTWNLTSLQSKKILLNEFFGSQAGIQFYSTGGLAAVPHSTKVLLGLVSGQILEYDLATAILSPTQFHQARGINEMKFISDAQFISCGSDNEINIWNYQHRTLEEKLMHAEVGIFAVASGAKQQLLASLEITSSTNGKRAGVITIWSKSNSLSRNVVSGKEADVPDEFAALMKAFTNRTKQDAVNNILATGTRSYGITETIDTSKYIYCSDESSDFLIYSYKEKAITEMDSVLLCVVHADAGKKPLRLKIKANDRSELATITISPDSRYVALAGFGGEVTLLETARFTKLNEVQSLLFLGMPALCSFSSNSRFFTYTSGNYIYVYDIMSRRKDTITAPEMITDLFIDNSIPAIVCIGLQHSYLYRLENNHQRLATMEGKRLMQVNDKGTQLVYAADNRLYFISISAIKSLADTEKEQHLKLDDDNNIQLLDKGHSQKK